jgi:1-acyl-sn-glycerol-3-phosphate acyltransferase
MQAIRSLIYVFLFVSWSTFIVILNAIFLPFPRSVSQATIRVWMYGTMMLLRVVVGLRYEIRGMERVPEGPVIFASKHQSAWDTAIYYMFDKDPAYILKKELLKIPLYGLTLRKAGHIAIDRDGGMSTLKHVLRETRRAIQEKRRVIIFPEGTRTLPGEPGTYQPGVAAIYKDAGVPLIPVALNSGSFWGRSGYMKYPGCIVMEFLPPIPSGLNRKVFMKELQQQVDEASERLRLEAETKYGLEPAIKAEN